MLLKVSGTSMVASNSLYSSPRKPDPLHYSSLGSLVLLGLNDLLINPFCTSKLVLTPQFFLSLGSSNFKFSSFKLDKAEGIVLTISEARAKTLDPPDS